MNRLQKKCLIAAAGTHFLVVVVILCSGFIRSSPPIDNLQVLTLVPVTDGPSVGVKEPKPAPPAPPEPKPPVPDPPRPEVKPVEPPKQVETVKPPEPPEPENQTPDPTVIKPKPKSKPHEVEPDLKPAVRKKPVETDNHEAEDKAAEKAAKRAHDAKVRAFKEAATSIKDHAASPTSIDLPPGTSPAAANYASLVLSVYTAAWMLPNDAASDDAVVKVSVTIANDGRVLSARIVERSGDPNVDISVQRALDRVTEIAPFPEGSKDSERTYPIYFDLKALRQMRG